MITAHNIGYMGQLGNQMFQYAALLGVAKRTGYEPVLPADNVNERVAEYNAEGKAIAYGLRLMKCFKIPMKTMDNGSLMRNIAAMYQEPGHNFFDNIFNIADATTIIGFFETERYFEQAKDEVRSHFIFRDEIIERASSRLKALSRGKKIVSLHIRHHTQYSKDIVHHPYIPLEYYQTAMTFFPEDQYDFLMFVDRKVPEENLNKPNIIKAGWDEGPNPDFVDLCMMTMCDHHIIANSSFSWWGAWLANKKEQIVVAPNVWFGPGHAHKNTEDIIPKRWIKI